MNWRSHREARQPVRILFGVVLGSLLFAHDAFAQRYYPRGYGGYGWGGWGATDPAAGYMAGLGSFARGQGAYEVEDAKAQAINLDTMLKWNKALRARQKVVRDEQQKEEAIRLAEQKARAVENELEDGTTLNALLFRIYDFDPAAIKSSRAKTKLGASAIREIPFEWDTEAITICIDQLTGQDAVPPSLASPNFASERKALREAVDAAIKEEAKGNVRPETKRRVSRAIAGFHDKYAKGAPDLDPDSIETEQYFVTLGSLTTMLNDPGMRKILTELGTAKDVTVGDLIAFMQSYNLRFGRATTPRQIEIYRALAALLTQVAADVTTEHAAAGTPDRSGKGLQSAAKAAFKGMNWKHLEAQGHEP